MKAKVSFVFFFVFCSLLLAGTHIPGGEVFGVWTAEGSPYYIDGEVHIPTDRMLVIEPGCSVIFTGHYKFCVDSNAVLKAIGTESDSIVFTAQDTVLTDTSGGHHGIRFCYAAEGCTLSYCRIEYGNAFSSDYESEDACGGGIWCYCSNLVILNSAIIKNSARYNGGGIYYHGSHISLLNSVVKNNSVYRSGGIYSFGGGIYFQNSNGVLLGDSLGHNSGWYGGNIFCKNSDLEVTNSVLIGGIAGGGGAIYCGGNSDMSVSNSIIAFDSSTGSGGGIYCINFGWIFVLNCAFIQNYSYGYGGGIAFGPDYIAGSPNIIVFNTIFWGNEAYYSGGNISLSYSWECGEYYICSLFVAYTDIDSTKCHTEENEFVLGPGVFNSDPLFADTLFHLSSTSPCIDAGAESVYVPIWDTVIYAPDYDFDGGVRPYGAGWDIGADEYGSSVIAENSVKRPEEIEISAYPNPFNSSCVITVPAGAKVEIYDLQGRLVYVSPHPLTPSPQGKGEPYYTLSLRERVRVRAKFTWSPDQSIPSGVYLIRAIAPDGQTAQKKAVLIR